MEHELILFETAKLYKSKGFGLYWDNTKQYNFEKLQANGCDFDYWYDKNGELCYIIYSGDEGLSDYIDEDNIDTSYIAPPQSVLQRWLREVHKIDIVIHRSFSMDNSYHYCIIMDGNYDIEMLQECIPDRSYEEALEDALFNALKLI